MRCSWACCRSSERSNRGISPIVLLAALLLTTQLTRGEQSAGERDELLSWRRLPDLPDPVGFACPFAGVSNNALIVAGGANFPDKKPWEGGTKIYHDRIFVLERPEGQWLDGGRLPRPIAYGVSVTTADGVICIGGNDAQQSYADVFLLQWVEGQVKLSEMPPLPEPLAGATGALIGNTVYVAGGYRTPSPSDSDATTAFLAMDLDEAVPSWRALESWPGAGRFLAVAGVHEGSLYLFGGVRRTPAEGGFTFDFLTDAYRYTPARNTLEREWTRLADLPRPNAAAPSPAPLIHSRQLILLGGGSDGRHADKPAWQHPGFTPSCLIYNIDSNSWTISGRTPAPRVGAPVVCWHEQWVMISGESRPGIRSPQIWAMTPLPSNPSPAPDTP